MVFENSNNLGRLKHTTKDDCPDCHLGKLQLRIRDDEGKESEYLYCPKCDYEGRPKKSKTDGIWKKRLKEESEYGTDLQHRPNKTRDDSGGRKGNKTSNKGNFKRV